MAAGGPGAAKANVELKRLKGADPSESGKNEIAAQAAKLKAKRALANPEEEQGRLFAEEQARQEEEKRAKEAEEKKKREESKSRLKEKAKLWH